MHDVKLVGYQDYVILHIVGLKKEEKRRTAETKPKDSAYIAELKRITIIKKMKIELKKLYIKKTVFSKVQGPVFSKVRVRSGSGL